MYLDRKPWNTGLVGSSIEWLYDIDFERLKLDRAYADNKHWLYHGIDVNAGFALSLREATAQTTVIIDVVKLPE